MPLTADVLYAGQLSDHEAAQFAEDFAALGLTTELREIPPRRTFGEVALLALVVVPLKPFFEQLAKDFAIDAYKRLKTLVGKVFGRSSQPTSEPPQVLLLQDSASGIQVVLEPDLPIEAYQQLMVFDLARLRRGPLHYDRHRRQWRSELDEATTGAAPNPDEE